MAAILNAKFNPHNIKITLGNIDFHIQHTQIMLKNHVPNFCTQMPQGNTLSEICTSLYRVYSCIFI